MGNKIITEKDFWRCSSGIVPVPLQNNGGKAKKISGETFITKKDKATSASMDFACKWIMLIAAILAAIIAVAVVATGGVALIAIGAVAGAVGAVIGGAIALSPLGSLLCGQRAAIARTWGSFKSKFIIQGQEAITGKDMMTCALFGDKITFAPEIKNWAQAYAEGGANFISGVLEGMLAGAAVGMLGAGAGAIKSGALSLSSASSAISMNSLRVLGSNVARNWLSTVGLQTGGRLGLQLAAKPVIAMAAGLRGIMGLEGGLRSYSQDENVDIADVGKGLAGMELGTVHSTHNIVTSNAGWQDAVGMALWFMPFHANTKNNKSKNRTSPEEVKNEGTKQVKNAEAKAKEIKGEFEAYEEGSNINLYEDSYFSDKIDVKIKNNLKGQLGRSDCALASLEMILKDFGAELPVPLDLAVAMKYDPIGGARIFEIPNALDRLGIDGVNAESHPMTINQLQKSLEGGSKAIVSVNNGNGAHAVIVDGINNGNVTIRDPLPIGKGSKYIIPKQTFESSWGRFDGNQGKVVIFK